MISLSHSSARALTPLLEGLRGLVTSAAIMSSSQGPTYTYASTGSSMSDPAVLSEASSSSTDETHSVTSMEEPAHRVTPSKKAFMLKVLSTPRRKLTPQGTGMQMLPPGCSISDPSYSIKDPVYFTDIGSDK